MRTAENAIQLSRHAHFRSTRKFFEKISRQEFIEKRDSNHEFHTLFHGHPTAKQIQFTLASINTFYPDACLICLRENGYRITIASTSQMIDP
jgi:hypothetical protein